MKRFLGWLKKVFFPPPGSPRFKRVLPYLVIVSVLLVVFLSTLLVWEETNSNEFCGKACHTMPPQYVTHNNSSHTAILCEDCHLGRAPLFESIRRKAYYSWLTGSAMVFNTYSYPIIAHNMSPANDACLPCHNPDIFISDKVMELTHYAMDENNTLSKTYLIMKTRGGSRRTGLGFGIHWHNENPVYFYASDHNQQEIPYIRMQTADGRTVEYIDSEVNFDPSTIKDSDLHKMDCITCHNRTAHGILRPGDAINQMMARNQISPLIPDIRDQANVVISAAYKSQPEALAGIETLTTYYRNRYADFYANNENLVKGAVEALKGYYTDSVFFFQKMDWSTHPYNLGHKDSPGCFRCHDGKHINASNEAVRLECNICHSIPVVSSAGQMVANIPVGQGVEPDSHKNVNWITLHRQVFDDTCELCHTTKDPGGASNTSFCSNSGCHGNSWPYAGFNAPTLREKLKDQLPYLQPSPGPAGPVGPSEKVTWQTVGPYFQKCTICHKAGGSAGFDLSSYAGITAGSNAGAQIVPGSPTTSNLIARQSVTHYINLSAQELEDVTQWIAEGALEK